MRFQAPFTSALLLLAAVGSLASAQTSGDQPSRAPQRFESTAKPIEPAYRVHVDGSATVRICFNWSCAVRQQLTFSAQELAEVGRQMSLCGSDELADRLQRLRIGIWQMEVLAQRRQPLLANDRPVNDQDQASEGRMDCVDNATNTATYVGVLRDLGLLGGWSAGKPEVRDALSLDVHWTATVVDQRTRQPWAVDAWFYGNGTLPFVMPLADWEDGRKGWEPPLASLNPYPRHAAALCRRVEAAVAPEVVPRSTYAQSAKQPSSLVGHPRASARARFGGRGWVGRVVGRVGPT